MSTLRVNKLENTNTSNGGISINSSGHVSIDGANFPTSGPLSNRNLIINGAMQVAQRGTQVTGVTTSGYRTCDRFQFAASFLAILPPVSGAPPAVLPGFLRHGVNHREKNIEERYLWIIGG